MITELIVISLLTLLAIPAYLHMARKSYLMDHPNERSSHSIPTLRGAGIIVFFSITVGVLFHLSDSWLLWSGLAIGTLVGFLDDRYSLPARYRALLYGLSLLTICYFIFDFFQLEFSWYMPLIIIVGLGAVNAYNFMDGINGITVLYTLLLLATVHLFIRELQLTLDTSILLPATIGCAGVGFLNLRKHALAFLGDVGSVLLGLVAVYFVASLMAATYSLLPLALLMVYGVDSILTIVERLFQKENIFKAHRKHLYQLLSNELKFPHLAVSVAYFIAQAIINYWVYISFANEQNGSMTFLLIAIVTGSIYLLVKFAVIKPAIRKKSL